MEDHLVLFADRLTMPQMIGTTQTAVMQASPSSSSSGDEVFGEPEPSVSAHSSAAFCFAACEKVEKSEDCVLSIDDEEEPLIQTGECRICQEEDEIDNLESPCTCSGSLKYAHRACIQHWCNEKGDIVCEICQEQYKPGYTAPPSVHPDETTIEFSSGWTITGSPLDLPNPRILAVAAAQHHFLEAEYDDYETTSGAAFCRSAALILIALLLLRHAMAIADAEGDEDDDSAFFSLFVLRAAGFLLPCYIMGWAISILQYRRQRQEAAAFAAREVAVILQSSPARSLQFTIAPESPSTPQHELHL